MHPRTDAIRPLLKRIGLDDREVEVYLALLPLKMARTSAIAKAAKQSRSHTYLILRSLEEKGLVSEVERGAIIHFIAEDPQRLLSLVQDRERELHDMQPLVASMIPVLAGLTGVLPGQPRITMLKGKEGVRQIYRDFLAHEFLGLFNAQAMEDAFGGNVVQSIFGKHIKLHARDLLVDNAAGRRFARDMAHGETYEARFLPKDMAFYSDTIIFGDTIALFAYDDEKTIVRIENKHLADTFRVWFEGLWSLAKRG